MTRVHQYRYLRIRRTVYAIKNNNAYCKYYCKQYTRIIDTTLMNLKWFSIIYLAQYDHRNRLNENLSKCFIARHGFDLSLIRITFFKRWLFSAVSRLTFITLV